MTQNVSKLNTPNEVLQDDNSKLKGLIKAGKILAIEQHYPEAKEIFEKVYKYAPDSKVAQSWLFFSSIFVDDKDRAYELFGVLFGEGIMNDSFTIGSIPQEYKDIFKEARIMENIALPYDDKTPRETIDNLNMIRQRITTRSYPYAIHLLNEVKANREKPRTSDMLEERLLKKAAEVANKRRGQYLKYIKNNDYDEFVHLLSDRIANHTASSSEEYLFKLYNSYENVKNGIFPEIKTENSEDMPKAKDMFEAIDDNDFVSAIKFHREFTKSRNYINVLDNPMHLLLRKIVVEMIKLSMKSLSSSVDTFNLVNSYLEAIEKTEYKGLIKQLIIIGTQKMKICTRVVL